MTLKPGSRRQSQHTVNTRLNAEQKAESYYRLAPTEAQLETLHRLGYKGRVYLRSEAARIISKLLGRRAI